jgi:hypothetical protein
MVSLVWNTRNCSPESYRVSRQGTDPDGHGNVATVVEHGLIVERRKSGVQVEEHESVSLKREATMTKFLLWLILLFFCWPLALLALVLYPIVWLLLLPFRLVGIAVDGVLSLLKAIILFPSTVLNRR